MRKISELRRIRDPARITELIEREYERVDNLDSGERPPVNYGRARRARKC